MNDFELLQRRIIVATKYLSGMTRDEIALELKTPTGCISQDLKVMRELWQSDAKESLAVLRDEELAKLRMIEAAGFRMRDYRLVLACMVHRKNLLGLGKEPAMMIPCIPWKELAESVEAAEAAADEDPIEERLRLYDEPPVEKTQCQTLIS